MIYVKEGTEAEVEQYLHRRFEKKILKTVRYLKEDLDMTNHLAGKRRLFIALYFRNCTDLLQVRKYLLPIVRRNKKQKNAVDTYGNHIIITDYSFLAPTTTLEQESMDSGVIHSMTTGKDCADYILDIREYDIPYYLRAAIDLDIRVGYWYVVTVHHGRVSMVKREDIVERAEPVVLAFDIETTKRHDYDDFLYD
jgi:DNA polymerase epsilon subunit 1